MSMWYRTESFSGSGIRDIVDIFAFEIIEFENYHLISDLESFIDLHCGDNKSSLRELSYSHTLFDDGGLRVSESMLRNIIKLLIATVGIFTHKDIKYGLWLASSRTVIRKIYGGKIEDIDCYNVEDAILLIDLGYDGALFGFEHYPQPTRPDKNFKLIRNRLT